MVYRAGLCNQLKELEGVGKLSSTEKTISNLKKKIFNYMILVHDSVCQSVKSYIFIIDDNSDEYEVEPDVVVFTDDEQNEFDQFVELGRKSLNCTNQQYFSMAIAWAITTKRSLLSLFTEVLFADDLKDTKK